MGRKSMRPSMSPVAKVSRMMPAHADRCFDYVHIVATDRIALEARFELLFRALKPDGMLWIS
jgi:hypothetical protein